MTRVKICGLTRASDARAAVAAGAQALGFVFAPSPRRVTPAQARRLLSAVPATVLRCGVFVDQPWAWVRALACDLHLDRLQFHGSEDAAYLSHFHPAQIVRALRPRPGETAPRRDPAPRAAALLVDAWSPLAAGGTGLKANWGYARALRRFPKTLILSGGLTAANVGEAIRRVGPDLVDVSSGVETRPGVKSPAKMRAFVGAVLRAS
jgi:phosphoribosylanthranilate isomerase